MKGRIVMYEDEHNVFREAFQQFIAEEITPNLDEWEEAHLAPKSVFEKMGENGFLCPWLPEEYGGSETDFIFSAIMTEELAKAGAVAVISPLHSDIIAPYIYHLGTDEQKSKWLPRCASGETLLAIAATEPNAGSDVAGFQTRAEKDGDEYVLNGSKTFISFGQLAGLYIVVARTDKDAPPHKGLSLFLVEGDTPGFSRGKKLNKMGLHAQDTSELFFDNCRIPAANLLGELGKGFYYFMHHLQQERLVCSLMAQGMAEAMLEMTVEYTRDRKVGGVPVQSFQANAFTIAEMATEIELGRTFIDSLTLAHSKGEDVSLKVTMAKAWIPEMTNRVAYKCVQLHGGYGYMEEYPICRFTRDARVIAIFAGTTEVMKHIISKSMGLY
jgi:acyl-CoA dehydrogenase